MFVHKELLWQVTFEWYLLTGHERKIKNYMFVFVTSGKLSIYVGLRQRSLKVRKTLMSVELVEALYVAIILLTIETITGDVLWKKVFLLKISQIYRKTSVPESLFKKETLAQVFSCGYSKFSRIPFLQNTFGRLLLSLNRFMLLFLFCSSWKHQ